MNLLVVGFGKGSWTMRGEQLGAALGARVTSSPVPADFAWADVVVLVKRAAFRFADGVRRAGKPIVWDALDFWSQPAQNRYAEAQARALLRSQLAIIRPTLTIGATVEMAVAAGGVCLPHHGWIGLRPTPPRDQVATVAYQGGAVYLGAWQPRLEAACARRGWRFVVNPPDLSQADMIVALRDGVWDGWMCREWKSGVKVVNAICAGRPLISQPSAAVRELQPVGCTVETAADLDAALDACADDRLRIAAAQQEADPFDLATLAEWYRQLLADRVMSCAA